MSRENVKIKKEAWVIASFSFEKTGNEMSLNCNKDKLMVNFKLLIGWELTQKYVT